MLLTLGDQVKTLARMRERSCSGQYLGTRSGIRWDDETSEARAGKIPRASLMHVSEETGSEHDWSLGAHRRRDCQRTGCASPRRV